MVHSPRALEVARLAAVLPLIIMTSMGHCRVVVEFPIGEDAPTDAAIEVAHAARDLQAIPVIARGQKAPCGRYPYVVSLQTRTGSHKCGGFLVNRYWVITAAHCVDDDSFLGPSPIVVIGACSLKDKRETVNENGEVEVVLTERTVVHENFTGDVTNGNDIAMLKLLSPSMHHPASLPMTSHIADGLEDVATIGWGLQEDGTSPVDLRQQSHVRIVPNKFCDSKDSWGSLIQDTMLCAFGFGSEQDTCQGDSGGPLFEFSSREGDISKGVPMEDVVIGITSFGEEGNCGRSELPAVFTRLSSYREWIDQKMGAVPVESSLPPPLSPSVPPPPSLPAQPPSPPLMQPMPPTEQAEIGSDVVPSSEPGEVEVLVTPTVLPEGCVCTLNGLSGSTPTRRAGCHSGAPGGVPLCYVKDKPLCEGALGRDSELFPGAYWIVCEGPRSVQAFARHGDKTSEEQLHLNQELVDLVPAKENATMRAQIRGLILDGANPNADFRSSTVLHLAAERGYLEVAVLLIEAGADIHAEDQLGATPLEEAAAFGHPDVADLLISLGANTDHRNNEGRRPWDAICFFVTCDMEQEAELRALLA